MDFLLERFAATVHAPEVVVRRFDQRLERRFGDDLRDRIDTERVARRIRIPTLIVRDVDDRDVHLEQGQRVACAWSGLEFIRTEGLRHSRSLRTPEVLERVVASSEPDTAPGTEHPPVKGDARRPSGASRAQVSAGLGPTRFRNSQTGIAVRPPTTPPR